MKFHIHMLLTCRIYLNHDSDCGRFVCQFLVVIFRARGVVSVCYSITQGVGLEKCYRVLHWVNGWCRLLLNGVVCTMQDKLQAAETLFEAAVTFEPHSILAWTMYGA